jgi:pimeloyl-ACP methyl ester carboxylesterase
MKKILLSLLLTLTIHCVYAQGIINTWYGALNIQGTQLHVVFHISKSGDIYETTMDSPDQHVNGIKTGTTTFANNILTIDAPVLQLKYTGTYLPDSNKINGTFKQGPGSLSLVLTNNKPGEPVTASRPQDPKEFPYKREEVVFANPKGRNQLAGTLTMPVSGMVSKIVVLISGSGPQNRDEEIVQFNHRPFLVWSDWLTRQGIAVLRYDDRGIGKSTGEFGAATSADFADDAEAAVTYIQSRADLKGLSIGLMGHSEGGMIAPMVASRNKAIKFIVLLAGPGLPTAQLLVQQMEDIQRLGNAPADVIKLSTASNIELYAAMNQYKDLPADQYKAKVDTLLVTQVRKYPAAALQGRSVDEVVKTASQQYNSPWFKYFITFNPADYLTKVTCPVLAVNGTLDVQVQSSSNLAAIKAGLTKAGNKKFEIAPLSGLNHMLQQATTGAISEYAKINETVDPIALTKVSAWINQLK